MLRHDGGDCRPAGVQPEACGLGFEADGQAGCTPLLPEGPCPRGQMAVPGELHCREVAPCGTGDYGTIPGQDDATTQFVNAAYPRSDSDGTRAKPWKQIQDGIRFARSGAVVAVAAGSYEEDLLIQHRPVRVWGRCPALVEVVGVTAKSATLRINSRNASRSEVHSLAIAGPGAGVVTGGSSDVIVDRLWIHDTMDIGVGTEDSIGETSVTISGSLIEATTRTGVLVAGADATIDASVVRDTLPRSDGAGGQGISIEDTAPGGRANVTLRSSLVERNHGIGVFVAGSDATIDASVVRATQPAADGDRGYGVLSAVDPATRERSALTLRGSLVEQNHNAGVNIIGADATIEATVVRATRPHRDGFFGRGVVIQTLIDEPERAAATLRGSIVEENHDGGVLVISADAAIESTVVRATRSNADGTFGDGITVASNGGVARASITSALVEDNARAGVASFSAAVLLVSSTVQCNKIDLNGEDEVEGQPFTFDGSRGNLVGCGAPLSSTMVVQSARLAAPPPIEPSYPFEP